MRVAVVGGGIAGLAAALRLAERGLSPRVLEAAPRPGGLVRSDLEGGRLLEAGADTLVTQKPAGVALCRALGLEDDLVLLDASQTATRVLRRGRFVTLPPGTNPLAPDRPWRLAAAGLLSWRGALRLALEPWVPARATRSAPGEQDDETLAGFVRRRCGREVLDAFAEPVLAGLFLADAERLSLRVALPRLLDAEAKQGSLHRGLEAARLAAAQPVG